MLIDKVSESHIILNLQTQEEIKFLRYVIDYFITEHSLEQLTNMNVDDFAMLVKLNKAFKKS